MVSIKAVWMHAGEPARIHYTIGTADGGTRRLYTDKGEALFAVLDAHLGGGA